jgi:hypothetical protein
MRVRWRVILCKTYYMMVGVEGDIMQNITYYMRVGAGSDIMQNILCFA